MKSITSKFPMIARLLLGLVFTVFGLNGFLNFLPMPPLPEAAGAFMGALAATGYMFPVIKGFEVLAGLMLLANRFTPLALLFLAPIVVNIFLFHLFLEPASSLPMPIILIGLMSYLGWCYRGVFGPVLAASVPTIDG